MESPTMSKLSSMHMYAWKAGLKTGMYYLRSKAKARPIQFSLGARVCGVLRLKFLRLNTNQKLMDKAVENIQFNEYNNRKIVISTKQGTPFRMQFPRMYMPFGVSGFTPEVGQTKYNVDFAIKGYDEDGSYMKKFYENLRKIEDMVIDSVD
jgi:ribonucleotide reductase alpha subunit